MQTDFDLYAEEITMLSSECLKLTAPIFVDGCRNGHSKDIVLKQNVRAIMNDILIPHNNESEDELFKNFDANCDDEVDFEDIKVVLERPNKVEPWIASFPLGTAHRQCVFAHHMS